jgi:MFS family permease
LNTISNPFLISLITTLVNVCSTPLSFWMVERYGRRNLLIVGGTGMVIAQYIVGIVGVTVGGDKGKDTNTAAVSAMIAFICINIFMFATTWGPCAWIVVGEIFPLPIRSRGVGLSTASNWFWNCIIAVITPYLVDVQYANLSSKIFFMWGSLCIVSVIFAFFLVPETKGLSLEQVDRMLEEVSPRKSRSWVPHSTFAAEMGLVEKAELAKNEHNADEKEVV